MIPRSFTFSCFADMPFALSQATSSANDFDLQKKISILFEILVHAVMQGDVSSSLADAASV